MNQQEIIKKAVEKAVENGWHESEGALKSINISGLYDFIIHFDNCKILYSSYYDLLFNHDFTKALFGELREDSGLREWQYHLQQLVILEDNEKIKYLKQFI